MFRVVTTSIVLVDGLRRRYVSKGPWHPQRERAETWALYLTGIGVYERVEVQEQKRTEK
jgi:hypothetical protein